MRAGPDERVRLVDEEDAVEGSLNRAVGLNRRRADILTDQAGPIDQLHAETLCYWLRKLVFRGAWLDHRVKAGLLDVAFDEASGGFAYRMPSDQSPLVELAPVPSWAELQYTDG